MIESGAKLEACHYSVLKVVLYLDSILRIGNCKKGRLKTGVRLKKGVRLKTGVRKKTETSGDHCSQKYRD